MIVLADWLYRALYLPPVWWLGTALVYYALARRVAPAGSPPCGGGEGPNFGGNQ